MSNESLFPSCDPFEAKWACMKREPNFVMVYSYHLTKTAAEYNAQAVGGWVVPMGKNGNIPQAVMERITLYELWKIDENGNRIEENQNESD